MIDWKFIPSQSTWCGSLNNTDVARVWVRGNGKFYGSVILGFTDEVLEPPHDTMREAMDAVERKFQQPQSGPTDDWIVSNGTCARPEEVAAFVVRRETITPGKFCYFLTIVLRSGFTFTREGSRDEVIAMAKQIRASYSESEMEEN